MALTLTPNGVAGCSPWREPWEKSPSIKSPEGATCISNIKAKRDGNVMEISCRPSRGSVLDLNQVPWLAPWATSCRHYRG